MDSCGETQQDGGEESVRLHGSREVGFVPNLIDVRKDRMNPRRMNCKAHVKTPPPKNESPELPPE
jgi:hypothetical protein